MNTTQLDTYEALLASNEAKKAERMNAQLIVKQKGAELEAARLLRHDDIQKLLKLKEGLDLRRAEKEDRMTRTTFLHEAGLLLPGEEIRKIRVGRMIVRKGVPL